MSMKLRSKTIGSVLQLLLFICLVLAAATAVLTIPYVVAFEFYYNYLSVIDSFINVSLSILSIMTTFVFLIWLYTFHQDLRTHFDYRDVSPIGSLIRMLPIINIWGIGLVFSHLGDFFKRHLPYYHKEIKRMTRLIPFIYLSFYGSSILEKLAERYMNDLTISLAVLITMIEFIVYLLMAKRIADCFNQLINSFEKDIHSNHENSKTQDHDMIAHSIYNINNNGYAKDGDA